MTEFGVLIRDLLRQTFRDPRGAAKRLMAMNPPMPARWLGVALVAVLSQILSSAVFLMLVRGDPEMPAPWMNAMRNPVFGLFWQAATVMVIAGLMTGLGRPFGGRGQFADALMLSAWISFSMIAVQLVQVAVVLILPGAEAPVALASFALFIWILGQMATALHGFASAAPVMLVVLVVVLVLGYLMASSMMVGAGAQLGA